jgi:small subunit ribosomal protein S16
MVKIRLMRMGKRKQPYFRVVVADSRSPRDGRFIENIGKYHPRAHPSVIDIDEERALHWLRNGAQPSDPVRVLFEKTGIWSAFTGQPLPAAASAPPSEASPVGPSDSASPADEPGSAEPSGPPMEAEASPEEEALGSSEGGADKPPSDGDAS